MAVNLVLVDGSGFIFRAFHALPPMTRPDGTPVNAVFGFTNMLTRLIKEHTGTHLAVIFDAGRHTFRNRLYDKYKAQRPEPPEELRPQFALVREATRAFGVPAIYLGISDDHARAASALGMAGMGASLGVASQVTDAEILGAVRALMNNGGRRREMRSLGLATMDGGGAARIAADLAQALKEENQPVKAAR